MILAAKEKRRQLEVIREAETWSDERRTCGVTIRMREPAF
jgi:hypothetical protein